MKSLELKVPPVVLVAIVATGMLAISRISPNPDFNIPGVTWLSAGIMLLGGCMAILGVLEFRANGTTVDPRVPDQSVNLVVSGVYRFSRNPMYLGFLLALCAWGLLLGSGPALLLLPGFVIYMNRFQIIPEERFMRDKFSDSYTRYRAKVRRWL